MGYFDRFKPTYGFHYVSYTSTEAFASSWNTNPYNNSAEEIYNCTTIAIIFLLVDCTHDLVIEMTPLRMQELQPKIGKRANHSTVLKNVSVNKKC